MTTSSVVFVTVGSLVLAAHVTSGAAAQAPKTWVTGSLPGDVASGQKSDFTLNEPHVLGFAWRSEERGAAAGYWELRQEATGMVKERVLASGVTADDPTKTGAQGFFEIDLRKYLPAQPPRSGRWKYYVRVKPLPVQQATPQAASDTSIGRVGGATAVNATGGKAPKGVGPWSAPVVINYAAATTSQK